MKDKKKLKISKKEIEKLKKKKKKALDNNEVIHKTLAI